MQDDTTGGYCNREMEIAAQYLGDDDHIWESFSRYREEIAAEWQIELDHMKDGALKKLLENAIGRIDWNEIRGVRLHEPPGASRS